MRIFSENKEIKLDPDSYVNAQKNGDTGRFSIALTKKQATMMDSRRFWIDIKDRLVWVEEGIYIVLGQMLFSKDRLEPYFMLSYQKDMMPDNPRFTRSGEERKTLLHRIRKLLRDMKTVVDRYELFEQSNFTDVEFALQSLASAIRQAFGEEAHETFYGFYRRLRNLWKGVSLDLDSPKAVGKELDALIDQSYVVFENLRVKCAMREAELDAEKRLREKQADAERQMEEAAKNLNTAISQHRKSTRILESVVGIAGSRIRAEEDQHSREAGLHRFNPNRRIQIELAIDLCHRCYPVAHKPCKGQHSLADLSRECWRQYSDKFEKMAELEHEPGFPNEKAFCTALYRLADNYQDATHFNWQT